MNQALRQCVRGGLLALLWLLALPASASVSVTDFTGHSVRLEQPARRIVALAPSLVENLYAAGAGDAIVGTVQFSDYPPAAQQIPRIGGYNSMSLEAIVALQPDLVVAWGSGGTQDLVKRLRSLDIPVYVNVPRHMADIGRVIRDFGQLTGHSDTADAAAARFNARIAALRQRYAQRTPVRLFYAASNQPLQTLSNKGLIGDVFKLCGGRNIFADAPSLAPRVSIESVLSRKPQAIVAGDAHGDAWKTFWQQWPALIAVQRQQLLSIPADLISRPSARIAEGAADLCRKLDNARRAAAAGQ